MGLEVKIDLNEGNMAEYAESAIKAELLKSAVKLIVEQFSPDRVTQFVEKVLTKSLDDFNSYQLSQEIRKLAEPQMVAALKRPEVVDRINKAVDNAVEEALNELPGKIKERIVEDLTLTIKRRLNGEKDRY